MQHEGSVSSSGQIQPQEGALLTVGDVVVNSEQAATIDQFSISTSNKGRQDDDKTMTDPVQIRRKIKANLNKLTVEKFVPIAEKIAQLLEACSCDQIPQFTDLIVDKALAEHALSEMYCDLLAVLRFRCISCIDAHAFCTEDSSCSVPSREKPSVSQCNPIQQGLARKLLNEFQRLAAPDLEDDSATREEQTRRKAKMVALFVLTGHLFNARLIGYTFLSDIISQVLTLREAKVDEPAEDVAECICRLLLTVGANLESTNEIGRCLLETILLRLEPLIESGCSQREMFWYREMTDARNRDWVKRSYASRPRKLDEANRAIFSSEATVGVEKHGHRRFMVEGSEYAKYISKQEEGWLRSQMPVGLASQSKLCETDLRYSQVSFSNPLDCAWLYNPEHPPNARSMDFTDSSLLESAADSPTNSETLLVGPRKRPATPMIRSRAGDEDSDAEHSAEGSLTVSVHLHGPHFTSGEDADDESERSSTEQVDTCT